MSLLSDGIHCPNCGSKDVVWMENQFYFTNASMFPIYRCKCGAYGRSRKSVITKEQKSETILPLAQ